MNLLADGWAALRASLIAATILTQQNITGFVARADRVEHGISRMVRWTEALSASTVIPFVAAAGGAVEQTLAWCIEHRSLTLPVLAAPPAVALITFALRAAWRTMRTVRDASRAVSSGTSRLAAAVKAMGRALQIRTVLRGIDKSLGEATVVVLDWWWSLIQDRPYLYEVARIRSELERLCRELSTRAEPVRAVLRRVGLVDGSAALHELLNKQTDAAGAALPAALRTALESVDPRAVAIPDTWQATIDTAMENHRVGKPAALLIVGHPGVGKSALVARIVAATALPAERVEPRSRNDQSALARLRELIELGADGYAALAPRIIVIDPLELCFLRAVGGYETLKHVLDLTQRGAGSVLWIVTCSSAFYNFARLIVPLDTFFSHRIDANTLDADALVALYERKFATAGFTFKIVPNPATIKTIIAMKRRHAIADHEVGAQLKRMFFREVLERGGASFPAINHAVCEAADGVVGRTVRLREARVSDLSYVNDFPLLTLFVLQALFIHRTMSAEELSQSLGMSASDVLVQLGVIRVHGLVNEVGGRYGIDPVVYRPLYELLRKKNLFQ